MSVVEDDCFFLAELWHVSPEEIMEIPYSRRRRYVEKKVELEKKRENANKNRPRRVR